MQCAADPSSYFPWDASHIYGLASGRVFPRHRRRSDMSELRAWSGQTALITGGADGLGFALAQRLAGRGVHVVLLDLDEGKLARARTALGPAALALRADVTDPLQVRAAVAEAAAVTGRIEILVNSAGITGRTNLKSHEVDLADFDRVMALNVRGCFITSQAVLPGMLAADYGRVLHIASIAGKEGNAGMVAYSASKAAVIGLTKVQGKDYAETGVRVNAVAPAVIRTEMVARMPAAQVAYMTDKIPSRRCGTLAEFAALAEFIVSPENSYTTGFCFDLSGGRATY
jgi:NAD(P)-dependent dehydrogenase (short-subunit alcohol dehydrogenase family)